MDFMVEQGWPNADLPDPWAWVDNDGQPVQGIFERFFMYLARVPDMTTSTYDWVLKWAQDELNRQLAQHPRSRLMPGFIRNIPVVAH